MVALVDNSGTYAMSTGFSEDVFYQLVLSNPEGVLCKVGIGCRAGDEICIEVWGMVVVKKHDLGQASGLSPRVGIMCQIYSPRVPASQHLSNTAQPPSSASSLCRSNCRSIALFSKHILANVTFPAL